MRKLLIILGILALVVGVTAWRLPAGLLLEPVQSRLPEVDWSDTEGTAWNGRIEGFAWKGLQLGTVAWEFVGLEGLDSGMTRWNVHGQSPQYELRAQVVLTPDGDVSEVFDLRGYAPASWIDITDRLPLIYLEGVMRFDIEHLVLENGLPLNGEGIVTWTEAAITGGASERFGALRLALTPGERGTNEGFDFRLNSTEPADLRVTATGSMLRKDYEVDLRLDIVDERDDLIGFMQQLGGEITRGRYRYQWQGNL